VIMVVWPPVKNPHNKASMIYHEVMYGIKMVCVSSSVVYYFGSVLNIVNLRCHIHCGQF